MKTTFEERDGSKLGGACAWARAVGGVAVTSLAPAIAFSEGACQLSRRVALAAAETKLRVRRASAVS